MFFSPTQGATPQSSVDTQRYVDDAQWQPFNYDVDQRALTFAHLPRQAQEQAVFLDRRFVGAAPKSAPVPVSALDAQRVKDAAGPVHFIFHTGFCCSTLLTRALDIPGVATGLREPGVLVGFARHWSNARQAAGALTALSVTLDLLSRPLQPGETQIVKPSNVCNHLLPEVLHLRPDSRVLLMHSSLGDFLAAIAKRDIQGRAFARQVFQGFSSAIPLDVATSQEEQMMQTDLQVAAQLWLMQMSFFNAVAAHYGPSRVRTLSGDAFLANKEAALSEVGAFFGLDLSAEQWVERAAHPVFREHAKERGRSFDDQAHAEAIAETRGKYEFEIAAAEDWGRRLAENSRAPLWLGETLFNASAPDTRVA